MRTHLITYTDRLGGDLTGLRELLDGPLAGLFDGVHVLPFFDPIDGADAGFDPSDHREVDPRLGTWADIEALSGALPVMADLIVNHVSAQSPQFRDLLEQGEASPYADMFLTMSKVFPEGASQAELLAIYRPRPGMSFTPYTLGDRTKRLLWTTFTANQIDLDMRSPVTWDYLDSILDRFAKHGVSMVRLDAVGYAIKTPGTSCFMTPDTFEFIGDLADRVRSRGLEVLVEIHSYWELQVEISGRVDWVYDFALPPLVLHALFSGTAERLRHWCQVRPRNAVTVLDTHDGIGVIDVGPDQFNPHRLGLLDQDELEHLIDGIHEASHGASRLAMVAGASALDVYQVNCTFYDALGGNDDAYLIARLVQLFLPGIPQVYYVGLLAGHNDLELLQRTGVPRDINRHHYTRDEVDRALERPVVRALCAALRLRKDHDAFDGTWELLEGNGSYLGMRWRSGDHMTELHVDVADRTFELRWTEHGDIRAARRVDELATTAVLVR